MSDRRPHRTPSGSTAAPDARAAAGPSGTGTASPRSAKAQARREKKEQRAQARSQRGPGYLSQLKQVYRITKEYDSSLTLTLIAIVLGGLVLFLLLGLLLQNWITWLLIGIPFAVVAAFVYLSRRAQKAAFARIEDQPGAAGAALSALGRGWIVEEQPIQIDPRNRDLVFRAVGRPGVVLVTEGPTGRVKKLVDKERRRIGPRIRNVPIHVISTGTGSDQVPLGQLARQMKSLEKKLTRDEVSKVHQRIAALPSQQLGIPKGIDPMRARPDRRALRGR